MARPKLAVEYLPEWSESVREACLHVATKLGDLLDEIVIVGGYVPQLLVPQESLSDSSKQHVGTKDLDLGLSLAVSEHDRYREISGRLRDAGFEMDRNEQGNPTRQRWVIQHSGGGRVLVDFLIPPASNDDNGGTLRDLEDDFAAFIIPGLELAFRDKVKVTVSGQQTETGRLRLG